MFYTSDENTTTKATLDAMRLPKKDGCLIIWSIRGYVGEGHPSTNIAYIWCSIVGNDILPCFVCCSPPAAGNNDSDGEYRQGIVGWDEFIGNPIESSTLEKIGNCIESSFRVDMRVYGRNITTHMLAELTDDLSRPEMMSRMVWMYLQSGLNEQLVAFFDVRVDKPVLGKIGQKIIVLNHVEDNNEMCLKYNPWRELTTAALCSNMVLMGITTGFPLIGPWFFIHRPDIVLVENKHLRRRFTVSDLSTRIVKDLEEYTRVAGTSSIKYSVNEIIDYIETNTLIAPRAMCLFMEHVGNPISDMVSSFLNPTYFNRYLFEMLYSIWCLHDTCGTIHLDLSAVNICMKTVEMPSTTWDIRGSKWSFGAAPFCTFIVDYSKAVAEDTAPLNIGDIVKQRTYSSIPHVWRAYGSVLELMLSSNSSIRWYICELLDIMVWIDTVKKIVYSTFIDGITESASSPYISIKQLETESNVMLDMWLKNPKEIPDKPAILLMLSCFRPTSMPTELTVNYISCI